MNMVYLLWENYHDEVDLVGIYSTREKAEKIMAIITSEDLPIYYEIEEREVN